MKAATFKVRKADNDVLFQSTPPVKAATSSRLIPSSDGAISIHAAREGGDHIVFGVAVALGYISIHAAREGGDPAAGICQPLFAISIHAAREGGDGLAVKLPCRYWISIHAAREGGDWRCRC